MVAKKELTEDLRIDEKQDLKGPFDLGVALERTVTVPQGEKVTAKMVVIGNALFMTNQWFNEQLNGDVFLNSVQWLTTGEEKTLTIRPRSAKNRRITLNVLQASVLVCSSLVIVPLLGIGGGIAVWWRRR
ncbi:MAG: ABC transporter, partial [Microcystaceae cyanobacterium]